MGNKLWLGRLFLDWVFVRLLPSRYMGLLNCQWCGEALKHPRALLAAAGRFDLFFSCMDALEISYC